MDHSNMHMAKFTWIFGNEFNNLSLKHDYDDHFEPDNHCDQYIDHKEPDDHYLSVDKDDHYEPENHDDHCDLD